MATGTVVEAVAEELEVAAVATRRLNTKILGGFSVGVSVGVAVGFYIGYRYSKKKLRVEIYAEAEAEIDSLREFYQQKIVSVDAQDKPAVEEIVKERGYAAEEESNSIQERVDYGGVTRIEQTEDRPLSPLVPVQPAKTTSNVFTSRSTAPKDENEDWDWEKENGHRDDDEPYILHQEEFESGESGYEQLSYIYYVRDDTLVDERDPQTVLINRENLIGEEALGRFGHGADDYNLVHVRNSTLQLEFGIHRIPESWEEQVLGLDANDPG